MALGNAPIGRNVVRQLQVVGQRFHAIEEIDFKLAGDVVGYKNSEDEYRSERREHNVVHIAISNRYLLVSIVTIEKRKGPNLSPF